MEKTSRRDWDWLSAVLLFFLIQVAAARLVTTNWTPFLYFAETLAAFGSALGLLLGTSRFGRGAVVWLTIGYSVVVLPWQMTGLVTDKLFLDRLEHAGAILLTSLGQFMQRQPVKDPAFFVAFASLVFWIISLIAGYSLMRQHKVLTAILPSAVVILMVQAYANYQPHASWWLAVYLLIALLLIGRAYYLKSRKDWSERRVFVNEEAWPDIFGGLFTTVALAVLIAWLIPTSATSVQAATDAWDRITQGVRDQFSNAVTSLNGPYGRPGSNFYASTLALGQNAALGDSPVFTVQVLKAPDFSTRYYWRGRVYDQYNNGRWTSSPASHLDFDPVGGDIRIPYIEDRSAALFQFTIQFPTQSLIYAPSQPVWVDRSGSVLATAVDTGLDDVLFWDVNPAFAAGNHYQVRAEIGNPTVQQLQGAGTSYPQWIKDRYLEVPGDIRSEFQALAEKVTEGQHTPYDEAAAITSYLRANLVYSTSLPPPPEDRDPIEWVLFHFKKGFCNYYASAEVLMLRSLGVPARLAVGFAQGEHQNNTFTVLRRDAHAWPEVFFPGLGWVEFEPTVIQDSLVRPSSAVGDNGLPFNRPPARPLDEGEGSAPRSSAPSTTTQAQPFSQTIAGRALLIVAVLLGISFLVYLFYRTRVISYVPVYLARAFERSGFTTPGWIDYWSRWNRLEPIERSFAAINWSLQWLGKIPSTDATPSERAASLKKLLPQAAENIDALTSELELGLFSTNPPDLPRARRAAYSIVVHAVRTRIRKFLAALDGRDVYSE